MSVVPLQKVFFVGPLREERPVLESLQQLECVHIITEGSPRVVEETPASPRGPDIARTVEALGILKKVKEHYRPWSEGQGPSAVELTDEVLAVEDRRAELLDRREFLRERIRSLEPWGDFQFPDPEAIGDLRLWFFVIPHYQLRRARTSDYSCEVVHRDHRNAYLVVLSAEEPDPQHFPVPRTHTGARSLKELRTELDEIEFELDELALKRLSLTRGLPRLATHLAAQQTEADLEAAIRSSQTRERLFVLVGWIPERRLAEVETLLEDFATLSVTTEPSADDEPPVLLDNPRATEAGESLVAFFQFPGYRDWDPSGVVAISFAIFFGMIIADAGYGLVLGAITALSARRLGRTRGGRRTRTLAVYSTIATVLFGTLAGSYFGLEPTTGSLLARLRLFSISDTQSMITLSITLGILHLSLANLARARASLRAAKGGVTHALAPVGWLLLLGGAGLFAATSGDLHGAGIMVLGTGAALLVGFSSTRSVTGFKSALERFGQGALALTGVTKIFGDVLSYLRLFALGLASASLAATFNDLAGDARSSFGVFGVVAAGGILLLGHSLNLVLALVGGVVHGLRLNLIEFFGWSLDGEGQPFRALATRNGEEWTA